MKRVAESQLTKDAGDNDDEPEDGSTGFQKADPSVLGARKIKGMPRRSLAAAAPPAAPSPPIAPPNGSPAQSAEPASRFSGFGGFGGSAGGAFTFTPPASQTSPTNNDPTPPTLSGHSLAPAPIPSVLKAFSLSTPSNPTPPSTPPVAPDVQSKQNAALKYCTSLRGLNISFLDAATKAVQADPFVDITQILDKYKSHRFSTQKEFDSGMSASSSKLPVPSFPAQDSLPKPSPSMPAPPKSFSSFGSGSGGAMSPGSQSGGFTPKVDPPSALASASPFSFNKSPGKTPETSASPFSSSIPADGKPSSGGFSFISGKADPTVSSSPFGSSALAFGATKSNAAESKPTIPLDSIFANNQRPPEKASPSLFNIKPAAPAAPLTPGLSSFLGSSKPGDTSAPPPKLGLSSPSPSSPSGFGFGASKNLAGSSPFGSFGKGSIGNPVGFAFGSPPATPSAVESSDPTPAPDSKAAADREASAESTTLSAPPDASHDPSPVPSQGSAYDADGPGEEDEMTIHETKAKAYRLTPSGEKKGWVAVGSGQLKLKAHVELAKRRLLMRNSSTGHIILNFNIIPGFEVKADNKAISFRVPGEDEAAAVYQVRVPNEVEAVKWQDTIRKEIEGLLPSGNT